MRHVMGLSRVDVLQHTNNKEGFAVVPLVKSVKYVFLRHEYALASANSLKVCTDFGGEKE